MAKEREIYDVAVIGSGPGGYVAALRAAELGLRTVCVEKESTFGGTCLNVGCIPSKALLQSSEYYEFLREEALHHGLLAKEVLLDFSQMQNRKREIVSGLVTGISGLFKQHKVAIKQGKGEFLSPNQLKVISGEREEIIEAKAFILATGSEAIQLPFLAFDERVVLSSTGALELEKIPSKMLLIGAGVIGVELASIYRRLGSQVTIIEMLDRICPTMDGAVSKTLLQLLKKQGLVFHLGAKVLSGENNGKQVALQVEIEGKEQAFEGDVVLVAVGRRPYTAGLGLEKTNVVVDQRGYVQVDANFRTRQSHIFAIGDLIDGPMLAHKASIEGVAVAELIAGFKPSVNYMSIPNVVYTYPEASSVGLTEQECKEKGLSFKCGMASFKANPRARCLGYSEGMIKVIADVTSGRLFGVHIVGPQASELIGQAAIAIDRKATLKELAALSFAHPTLSETFHEAILKSLAVTE